LSNHIGAELANCLIARDASYSALVWHSLGAVLPIEAWFLR
jgi:hypothetical protein